MRTLVGIILLLLAQGFSRAEEPAPSLRIASYNVNFGNVRGDQVLDAVEVAKADILFFQETTLQSEQFLQVRLKRRQYPHFHAAGHEGRFAAERFAFASKIPLADVAFTPPGKGLFGFYSATCEIGGTRVTLVNVHLTPFTVPRDAGVLGMIQAAGAVETQHTAEIEAIAAQLDPRRPAIIAGDFNSPSTFAAPARLRNLGLIDSFAAVHEDPDTQTTWHWPTSSLTLRGRIDYIFHTAHFRAVHAAVIPREGSDHFLLVSELELVKKSL